MQNILISLFLLLFASSALAAKNPFTYACKEEGFKIKQDQRMGITSESMGHFGFEEIPSPIDLSQAPQTTFWRPRIPFADPIQNTLSFDLVELVLAQAQQRVIESRNIAENITYCMEVENPPQECNLMFQWMREEVPKFVREARYHLALSQSPHAFDSKLQKAKTELNHKLKSWSLYKHKKWKEMDVGGREYAKAQAALDNYKTSIAEEFAQKVERGEIEQSDWNDFFNTKLIVMRMQHYDKYMAMHSILNMMQYLEHPDTNRLDIYEAARFALERLDREQEHIDKLLALNQESRNEYDPSASLYAVRGQYIGPNLEFMKAVQYTQQLEEVLLYYPEYCPLASSMVRYVRNQELNQMLQLGLPLLATSFMLPPISGMLVGLASGLGFASHTEYLFQKKIDLYLGHIYGDQQGLAYEELSALKRAKDFEWFLLPTALGGIGILGNGPKAAKLAVGSAIKDISLGSSRFFHEMQSMALKLKEFSAKKISDKH